MARNVGGMETARQHDRRPLGVVFEPDQADAIVAELQALRVPVELVAISSEESLTAVLEDADFLVATAFDSALFERAHHVTWVQSLSAGVDAWLRSTQHPPWPITRMTGLYEKYIAQYVLAHLLHRSQQLEYLKAAQLRREWIPSQEWMTRRAQLLGRQVLGVAGLGLIGQEVARLGHALDMEIRGLRRTGNASAPGQLGVSEIFGSSQLTEFLTGLDVLVLTLPLTTATEGMIGREELARLNRGAVVVNVARGAVLDDDAVCDALEAGSIGAAILDTFSVEPLPETSRLWRAPGVTVTPHIAGEASPGEIARVCATNIETFLRGVVPGVVVDYERGY